jgi:hypothetical protein
MQTCYTHTPRLEGGMGWAVRKGRPAVYLLALPSKINAKI